MSTEASDLLRLARALISEPKRWTQRAFARNADGSHVRIFDGSAVCWCATGALAKVAENNGRNTLKADRYLDLAVAERGLVKRSAWDNRIAEYNDTFGVTHSDIMAVFDRAIELAEKA